MTAIPKFERYTINPKLFVFFNPKTEMVAGVNFTTEDRIGGDIDYIRGNKPSGFFEENNTDRLSTEFSLEHHFGVCSHVSIRNSFNHFKRSIASNGYAFDGTQNGTFMEATYAYHGDKLEWVTGLNLVTDQFREIQMTTTPLRNYDQLTAGFFIQNTWKVHERLHIETGLRGDGVRDYGFALLPRFSALFKFTPALSSRIGGGMGYKAPTIFSDES